VLSQPQLKDAYKTLMAQWDRARVDWDDSVSQQFAEKYMTPMDHHVRKALAAMEQMSEVLQRVQRDCQ